MPADLPGFDLDSLRAVGWLADLADLPGDASPPLLVSPLPSSATGSYGAEAEAWIAGEFGITLRWWQRLAIRLQLAHRADGSLVFGTVIESTPRRSGKSVRLRATAAWRCAHPERFGEVQLVVMTAKDTAIVLEHHRRLWQWARARGWVLRRRTGAEEIVALDESRVIVRSQQSVYGYDTTLGIVDEAWGVPPAVVDDGLEPTLLERLSPQLHLVSTSHRKATGLMRGRLLGAIRNGLADEAELVMVWAAPPEADLADPAVWRSANPHWTGQREATMSRAYERAMAGTSDDPDDDDPVGSFAAQYLNMAWWTPPGVGSSEAGAPVVAAEEWDATGGGHLSDTPLVLAVAGWFGEGVSVAGAELDADGRVCVAVGDYPDLPSAAAYVALRAAGVGGLVIVADKSIAGDVLLPAYTEPASSSARQCMGELRRLLDDDQLRHDGSPALAGQVLAMRTKPSPEGPRLISLGRLDAVKAAVWAANRARNAAEKSRIF